MDHGILVAALLEPSTLLAFLKGAFGLGIVIFVHELGHFLVAKACGVKCEKFYVGFDPPLKLLGFQLPRTLFKKQWGETEYGIGIVPLGGYVKMLGQDDNPANAAAEAERIKTSGETLDPRSYPAKSVPQRMAIISAGVLFNLFFGLVFAAIAYKMGVHFTPTVIGGTSVGDPAWVAGIQPGDRIVSLDPGETIDRRLRFRNDLQLKMFSLAKGDGVEMLLENPQGEVRQIKLEPDSGYSKRVGTPTIGVWMAQSPTIAAVTEGSTAEAAGLQPGDRIQAVTVDGVKTEIDIDGIGIDLQRVLARSQNKPITLTVIRTDAESSQQTTKQVKLAVNYKKRFGIELTMGPVQCVQKGSVADRAGIRKGDIITELNGAPIGDPLTLPIRMLEYIGQSTVMTVKRAGETMQIELVPEAPSMLSEVRRPDGPIGLDPLGIGYSMDPQVGGVISGSPAARAGIQSGDKLLRAKVVISGAIPDEQRWPIFAVIQDYFHDGMKNRRLRSMLEAYELNKQVLISPDHNNWPYLVTFVPEEPSFEIDLTYESGGKQRTVRLAPEESNTMIDISRGFFRAGYEETLTAASWSEAVGLGYREVLEGMQQVVVVLQRLSSNYKNLGGPITIARVATMEASEGLPRLLVFLTLLSANLAVLNFLPIPVLDGGHMLFLAYEGIVGKPVNERIQMSLTLVGFSLLMGLMIFVFGLDISRILG